MRKYMKPVISIDDGMAEGVYAASGATSGTTGGNTGSVTLKFLRYDGDWGTGGTAVYQYTLSGVSGENLLLTIDFNYPVSGAWGTGSSGSTSGKTATFSWSQRTAETAGELFIQVQGTDIKLLKIEGHAFSNQ